MKRSAAALTVALLAGCSSSHSSGATLRALEDGDSRVGSEHPDTSIGTTVLLPMRSLCTSAGPIRITGVELRDPTGGISVATWGTRKVTPSFRGTNGVAGGPGRVQDIPGFGHHLVSVACTGSVDVMQFSVSLRAAAARATASGVVLHYGDGRRAVAQYDVALCAAATCAPA